MPYTLSILPLLDDGGFYSAALPSLTGRIFSPPPPSGSTATPLDTATSSNLTLLFNSAVVPPAGSSAMIVTEPGIGGDFLRSGVVNALPPSPAAATAITFPTAAISSADISAAAGGFSVASVAIPAAVRIACGLLSAGTFIPLTASIGPATATTGAGSITLTVPGSVTVLVFYGFVRTYAITITTTASAAPAGDPTNPARILAVTLTPITMSGLAAPIGMVLGPFFAPLIAAFIEPMINGLILSTASSQLNSHGLIMTPTAVISARKVTITPAGASLQLVLADLFGPGVTPPPKTLAVAITPHPTARIVPTTYTITVTDSVTGAPVPGATVSLFNFGTPTTSAQVTDMMGQAVFPDVILKYKKVSIIETDDGKPKREWDLLPPTLTVTANGYNTVNLDLL